LGQKERWKSGFVDYTTSHYGQLYSRIEDYELKERITINLTGPPIETRALRETERHDNKPTWAASVQRLVRRRFAEVE
jgi:hypothetical protein